MMPAGPRMQQSLYLSSYWATSPTSSAPLARRRATASSTLSTVNMTLRRPSVFGGAIAGSISTSFGLRNFVSSSRPCIWGPHHNDVDLDTFEPVDAVHPRALDRHLAFERHAERGEKSDSGCKVLDDADVVQSLDRHVPRYSRGRARRSKGMPRFLSHLHSGIRSCHESIGSRS